MSSRPSSCVEQHFQRLCLNATSEWISACVQWCGEQTPAPQSDADLIRGCLEQWQVTDLREDGVQKRTGMRFPSPEQLVSQRKCLLPTGAYTVQLLWSVDVAQPAYAQLMTLKNVRDDNSSVSADIDTQRPSTLTRRNQQGDPHARMLKMGLTNGWQTIEAIEHERIPALPDGPLAPGLKLTLRGPIHCRRGLLFLTPKHVVKVHGGSVEEMKADGAREKTLTDLLSRPPPGAADGGNAQPVGLPTQQYVPQGRPMVMKPGKKPSASGGVGKKADTRKRTSAAPAYSFSKSTAAAAITDDPFNDTDDELLASIDLAGASSVPSMTTTTADEDVFNDEDDFLLSQIEIPSPSVTRNTNSSMYPPRTSTSGNARLQNKKRRT